MGMRRTCDVCQRAPQKLDPETREPVDVVQRYTLRRDVVRHRERGERIGRAQYSFGSIDLCDDCLKRIAGPRMNPRKRRVRPAA